MHSAYSLRIYVQWTNSLIHVHNKYIRCLMYATSNCQLHGLFSQCKDSKRTHQARLSHHIYSIRLNTNRICYRFRTLPCSQHTHKSYIKNNARTHHRPFTNYPQKVLFTSLTLVLITISFPSLSLFHASLLRSYVCLHFIFDEQQENAP